MTIEQKEAVNRLKELVILRKSKNKIKYDNCICATSDLDMVLNLVQDLQRKNFKLEHNDIPKQKVKENIKEARYNKKVGNTAYEYTEEDVWEIVKDNLEELLEDT